MDPHSTRSLHDGEIFYDRWAQFKQGLLEPELAQGSDFDGTPLGRACLANTRIEPGPGTKYGHGPSVERGCSRMVRGSMLERSLYLLAKVRSYHLVRT